MANTKTTAESTKIPANALMYSLDNMANVNVVMNPNLLTKIRTAPRPMLIDGVGGKSVLVRKVGDHPLFGTCWYFPDNEFNVISQDKALEQGFLLGISEDNLLVWLSRKADNLRIYFHKDSKDRFYKCPVEEVDKAIVQAERAKVSMINNAAAQLPDNLEEIYGQGKQNMLFTEEQLRRMDIVAAMHISMDHPSDEQLCKFISSPSTINCPVTIQDLKNLRANRGPCPHCLEGKPKPHK